MAIFHSIVSIIVIKVDKNVITYQRTTLIINQGHEQGQEVTKLIEMVIFHSVLISIIVI